MIGSEKVFTRDGFGRFADYSILRVAVGWFKDDLPFGKMLVFSLKEAKQFALIR